MWSKQTSLQKHLLNLCLLPWRLYGIFTQTTSVKCTVLDEVWSCHGKQILFYYTNFCHFSKDLHELLNQVGAGLLPAHPWFLKTVCIDICMCVRVCVLCVCVFVCMCVSVPRILITSGMTWHDKDHIWLVKQVLQLLYDNCSRYHEWAGLGIDTRHEN